MPADYPILTPEQCFDPAQTGDVKASTLLAWLKTRSWLPADKTLPALLCSPDGSPMVNVRLWTARDWYRPRILRQVSEVEGLWPFQVLGALRALQSGERS